MRRLRLSAIAWVLCLQGLPHAHSGNGVPAAAVHTEQRASPAAEDQPVTISVAELLDEDNVAEELGNLVIHDFKVRNASLAEVVALLNKTTKPKGVTISLEPALEKAARHLPVCLSLKDIPALDLLQCLADETKLDLKLSKDGARLLRQDPDRTKLVTRRYNGVTPDFFGDNAPTEEGDCAQSLAAMGVLPVPGGSATYSQTANRLSVCTTKSYLALVELLLRNWLLGPSQETAPDQPNQ